MLRLPLGWPLFIDKQTAGKGVVIFSFDSRPSKTTKYPHVKSLQTEIVKQKYQKGKMDLQ